MKASKVIWKQLNSFCFPLLGVVPNVDSNTVQSTDLLRSWSGEGWAGGPGQALEQGSPECGPDWRWSWASELGIELGYALVRLCRSGKDLEELLVSLHRRLWAVDRASGVQESRWEGEMDTPHCLPRQRMFHFHLVFAITSPLSVCHPLTVAHGNTRCNYMCALTWEKKGSACLL